MVTVRVSEKLREVSGFKGGKKHLLTKTIVSRRPQNATTLRYP